MIEPGLEPLSHHSCPICGRSEFHRGPAGGAAVNIECKRCGQRYNVATHDDHLIMAQRIAYNGYWPDRGDW